MMAEQRSTGCSIILFLVVVLLCLTLVVVEGCISSQPMSRRSMEKRWREKMTSTSRRRISKSEKNHLQTHYYQQVLDHFNNWPDTNTTLFPQKYVLNNQFWGGSKSNSPIFVYLGGEWTLDDWDFVGLHTDRAPEFNALLLFIEHRYYGESMPFGSPEEAFQNSTTAAYLSTAQALADFAVIITHVKEKLSAQSNPVIVFGCSYAGLLASWFRLKYPQIAYGAIASSATNFDFYGAMESDEYNATVSRDFREASEKCYDTIKKSWAQIDEIVARPDGLDVLSQTFHSCTPLNDSDSLKCFLIGMYQAAAQYGAPPDDPLQKICNAIDQAQPQGNNDTILKQIFAGVVANDPEQPCYNMTPLSTESYRMDGWNWQICTEIVPPLGKSTSPTMFQDDNTISLQEYIEKCNTTLGVTPRPNWATTEYVVKDMREVLRRFGSNIIFSNGLRDPYSYSGVLQNISESIRAVYTAEGSHCLDFNPSTPQDPDWLVEQREEEVRIIREWLSSQDNHGRLVSSGERCGKDVMMWLLAFLLLWVLLGF